MVRRRETRLGLANDGMESAIRACSFSWSTMLGIEVSSRSDEGGPERIHASTTHVSMLKVMEGSEEVVVLVSSHPDESLRGRAVPRVLFRRVLRLGRG